MRRGRLLLLGAVLAAGAAPAGPAQAGQVQLLGEVRTSGLALFGSQGQFGASVPGGPCGQSPSADGGAYVSGTGVLFLTSPSYRYRLALSAGYFGVACTDSLRRPLAGLDFRGRHHLDDRTQIRSGLRANLDVFDRTLDIRLGTFDPNDPGAAAAPAAGTVYLTGNANLEFERWLDRHYALRAGASLQTLQVFTDVQRLSEFTTLGPMTAAEVQVDGVREMGAKDRLELPVRYRVSHYYPVTMAKELSPGAVPPAHDGSARLLWERRLTPLWTLHLDGGVAVTRQDHLCQPGPALLAKGSCSIDQQAPGIRGAAGRPLGEVLIGRRTTGTVVGEASVRYQSQKHTLEASLTRGYEPNAYASALDLVNRLSATALVRPRPDLLLAGSVLFGHHGHTSPGRLSFIPMGDPDAARVSPQNRTMVMWQGSLGADWTVRQPVSLFCQADAQVFAIRGEQVQDRDAMGVVSPDRQVSGFPPGGETFQTVWRLGFLIGVRVFTETPEREPNLLQNARTVP